MTDLPMPYYTIKGGRAYWSPTKRMRAAGFIAIALGPDGADARAQAAALNARWQQARQTLGRAEAREPAGRHFVYFLQCGDKIKIGFSAAPLRRVGDVAGGAHARMSRLVVVPGGREDERRLHLRFNAYRVNAEWFAAERALLFIMGRCAMAGRVVHMEERTRRAESDFRKHLESDLAPKEELCH